MKAAAAAVVAAIALVLSLPARAQRDDVRWRAMPEVNPLVDGVFVRPVEFPVARGGGEGGNDVGGILRQLVMYDFRPAFPPYSEKSLAELLLVPKPKKSTIAASSEERKLAAAEISTEVEYERTDMEGKPSDGNGDRETASRTETIAAESPSSKGSDERLLDSGYRAATTNGKRPQDHDVRSEANEDVGHDAEEADEKPPTPSEEQPANIEATHLASEAADKPPSKQEDMGQQQEDGIEKQKDDSIGAKETLLSDRTPRDLEAARVDVATVDASQLLPSAEGDNETSASVPASSSKIEGHRHYMEKEVGVDGTRREEGVMAKEQLDDEPNVVGPTQLSLKDSAESAMEVEDNLSHPQGEGSETGGPPVGDREIKANAEEAADVTPPKAEEGMAEMASETSMTEDDLEEEDVASAEKGADMQNLPDSKDTASAHATEAEAPKAETPKVEAPKAETPKADAPKAAAKAAAPGPKVGSDPDDAPAGERTSIENDDATISKRMVDGIEPDSKDTASAHATEAEAPKAETPKVEAPKAETPKADATKAVEKAAAPGPKVGSEPDDAPVGERISIENDDATNSKRIVDGIEPTVSAGNNRDANRLFVDGLDEIDKLFESVDVPDELDVGADGSSMQDVLVGQGLKIAWKRARNFGRSMKGKFQDIAGNIKKALPLGMLEDDNEGETAFDALLRLKGLSRNSLVLDEQENGVQKDGAKKEGALEEGKTRTPKDKHKLRKKMKEKAKWSKKDKNEKKDFPLIKIPQATRIWKLARRKWEQAKYLLDDLFNLFEGAEDDDEFGMKLEDIRKDIGVVGKGADTLKKLDGKFGSDVDESFLRSRYEEMLKQQQQKKNLEK